MSIQEEIDELKEEIAKIKPDYEYFNKFYRLSKTDREEKKEIGTKLFGLYIQLIGKYQKLEKSSQELKK